VQIQQLKVSGSRSRHPFTLDKLVKQSVLKAPSSEDASHRTDHLHTCKRHLKLRTCKQTRKKTTNYFASGISNLSTGPPREDIPRHVFLAKQFYMDFAGKGRGRENRKMKLRVKDYSVFVSVFHMEINFLC